MGSGAEVRKWCSACLPSVGLVGRAAYGRRWRELNVERVEARNAERRAAYPAKRRRRYPARRSACGAAFFADEGVHFRFRLNSFWCSKQ